MRRDGEGRRTRRNGGGETGGRIDRFRRMDARHGYEEGRATGQGRDIERADAHDEDDGIVEIVVIPAARDPRGVGGIGVRRRREPDDERNDDYGQERADERHAVP